MSRIFWDTNLLIYLIEDFRDLSERVINLRRRMVERSDELYTSALILGEILIKPLEAGEDVMARRYEAAFSRSRDHTFRCRTGAPLCEHSEGSQHSPARRDSARLRGARAYRSVYHQR